MRRYLTGISLAVMAVAIIAVAVKTTYAACDICQQINTSCTKIPGTSQGVGASCIQRSSFPTLNSPVDPRVTYGADDTGATNSASAFQSAVTAAINAGHDVHVTCHSSSPCTFKISDGGTTHFPVHITGNLNIQCDSNVTLYDPDHDTLYSGMFFFDGGTGTPTVTAGGVQGCTFLGANSGSAPLNMDSNQSNYPLIAQDASGLLFEGNTFSNSYANAAMYFGTNQNVGVTGTTVKYNTFNQNPLYGFVITAGGTNTIQYNLSIDSQMGDEYNNYTNNAQANTGHNAFSYNYIKYVNGVCSDISGNSCGGTGGVGITGGGVVDGFTGSSYTYYSTDTVENNYCAGGGSSFNHSFIYDTDFGHTYLDGHLPTYSNNTLGTGCACWSGNGSC